MDNDQELFFGPPKPKTRVPTSFKVFFCAVLLVAFGLLQSFASRDHQQTIGAGWLWRASTLKHTEQVFPPAIVSSARQQDTNGTKTVILIHASIPVPDMKGSDSRIVQVVRAFIESGVKVVFVCTRLEPGERLHHRRDLEALGVEVLCPIPATPTYLNFLLTTRSVSIVSYFVWGDSCYLYWLAKLLQQVRLVSNARLLPISDDAMGERSHEMLQTFFENMFWRNADMIGCLSHKICETAKRTAPGVPTFLVRYVFPATNFPEHARFRESHDLAFVGYINTGNQFAVEWFANNAFAPLQRLNPGVRFHVYGQVPCEVCAQNSGFVMHGQTMDVELKTALQHTRVFVAPVFEEVGISTKIVRAMAAGVPVVTTRFGANLAARVEDQPLRVADCEPSDGGCFAEEVNRVYTDQKLWSRLSKEGREFVEREFGFEPLVEDVRAILNFAHKPVTDSGRWKVRLETSVSIKSSFGVVGLNLARHLAKRVDLIVQAAASDTEQDLQTVRDFGATVSSSRAGAGADRVQNLRVHIRQMWPPSFERPEDCPHTSCALLVVQPWEFGSIPEEWLAAIIANASGVIVPSTYVQRQFTSSGVPAALVHVVPNGVNCEDFPLTGPTYSIPGVGSEFVFLYTGGLLPRKGVDVLLRAWKSAFPRSERVVLVIHSTYNHGFDTSVLESAVRSTRGPRVVWLKDFVPNEAELLRRANVLVHPARAEGFGLTVLEAMALGIPVITTKGTAMDDFVSPAFVRFVDSVQEPCRVFPCSGRSLCVFPNDEHTKWDVCKSTVHVPHWREPSQQELISEMRQMFKKYRLARVKAQNARDSVCSLMSWERAADMLMQSIDNILHTTPFPGSWGAFTVPPYVIDALGDKVRGAEHGGCSPDHLYDLNRDFLDFKD